MPPRAARLSFLTALALTALPACDLPGTHHESLEFEAGDVDMLEVDSGSGDIIVVGDPDALTIRLDARVHGDHTEIRSRVEDGRLRLWIDCPKLAIHCAVDWTLVVPQELAAALETGSGDIMVSDLVGTLRVETGSGDIELDTIDAPSMDLHTGSGDLVARSIVALDVEGSAGSGDLELDLDARARRVALTTGSGDIHLELPRGDYDVSVETGSGDVDSDGITDDPSADARIELSTGSGDITLRGS